MQNKKIDEQNIMIPIPEEAFKISGIVKKPIILIKAKKNKIILKGINEPKITNRKKGGKK